MKINKIHVLIERKKKKKRRKFVEGEGGGRMKTKSRFISSTK